MEEDKDEKDNKTIFEKLGDAVKSVMDTASAAATKAMEPDSENVAKKANEQVLVGDAAIAPGAAPGIGQDNKPPMTADEIAHHAAADTQPVVATKKPPKTTAAPSLSGRITPDYDFPVPDTPMPSLTKQKAATKKAEKSVEKLKAKTKSAKKTVKKSKVKKAAKKTAAKKSKKTAPKKSAKKSPARESAKKSSKKKSKR